jgi:hypothetical protein
VPIQDLASCSKEELDACLGAFSWAILVVAACLVAPALVCLFAGSLLGAFAVDVPALAPDSAFAVDVVALGAGL